jgi:hypothetical protein
MSQDDDARLSPELIAQLNKLASRLTAQGEYEACDLIDTVVARVSAMPGRELLAEALEALTPFEQEAVLWDDLPEPPDEDKKLWIGSWGNRYMTDEARFSLGDLRRARAAADKIRAALTQEKQT